MVLLLIIKSTYQLCKLQRLIFRFADNRNGALLPAGCKYHKEQDGNHTQVQCPAKRRLRKEIAKRRHLYLGCFFHIAFGTDNGKSTHLGQYTKKISRILPIQHTIVRKKQGSGSQYNFPFSPRNRHGNRMSSFSGNSFFRQHFTRNGICKEIRLTKLGIETESLLRINRRIPHPAQTVFRKQCSGIFFQSRRTEIGIAALKSQRIFQNTAERAPRQHNPVSPSRHLQHRLHIYIRQMQVIGNNQYSAAERRIFLLQFIKSLSRQRISLRQR